MQSVGSQTLITRMIGAARLDIPTYEEVEKDESATTQALIVVALASIAAGIGALRSDGLSGLIGGTIAALLGWAIFSFCVYVVGTRLLATSATEATPGQVMRTLGFSYSPQILAVVGFIPVLGPIVAFIVGIWAIVAAVIGIRQALEMSTLRTIATILIAAIPAVVVLSIIYSVFNINGF